MKFIKRTLRELYPYQQRTLEHILENNKQQFAVFWEMRLGKTLLTIRFAKAKQLNRVLIVCPLSVVEVWKRELSAENLPCIIFSSKDTKDTVNNYQHLPRLWVVTNYEYLLADHAGLVNTDNNWDLVICDEGTKIRNPDTKISQLATTHFRFVPYRIILTGSPTPNSLLDYYQQFKFLFSEFLGAKNWYEFKNTFFTTGRNSREVFLKYKYKKEFEDSINANSYRLKKEDVDIGSNKVYSRRYVEFDKDFREYYNNIEESWKAEISDDTTISTKWAIVAQQYLHQLCGGYPKFMEAANLFSDFKCQELLNLINGELKGQKLVIWTAFRREQSNIIRFLQEKDFYAKAINGSTPTDERTKIIDSFFRDVNYLVCTPGTLDMGVDLSCSDTTIYYSNSWSREKRIQSEDRIIHPNKRHPMLYIDLLVKNTVDEDILNAYQVRHIRTEIFEKTVYMQYLKRLSQAG